MKLLLLTLSAAALLAAAAFAQAPAAEPGEWKILFDGTKVTGFRGLQKPEFLKAGWKIADGALFLEKEIKQSGRKTGGDLVTTDAFADFEFHFEFKIGVSGNSGVLYLTRPSMGQAATGHEFQLIDDMRHPEGLKGGPIRRTGSLNGILPTSDEKAVKYNEWNEAQLKIQGAHVEHWLNGAKVLEYDLQSPALQQAVRAAKARVSPSFGTKFRTPILLLDEGEDVSFRNLKIRALPAAGG